MKKEIKVLGTEIRVFEINKDDYICLTDIAKQKNPEFPADVVKNWLKTKFAIEFLGIWEQMYNKDFKLVEFYQFKNEA